MAQYLYVFMTALSAALIMVPFLRRWALSTGNVDVPDARKVHTTAIPRIGGIAIFMAFLFSLLVYADLASAIRGLLAGALIIFVTGFIDDLHGISPKGKFFGEICGCLVTMAVGKLYIADLGNLFGFGAITLPVWLAVPFTLFAVVGVINAVNLIDGLDGLAGGVSVIAAGAFFILGWHTGNTPAMLLSAALIGAILGFLKYNYYPARIFMGDTGSLVVGFVLGFLAVLLTKGEGEGVSAIVPALILGLPIIDTVWVMCSRILQGQSPFAPDMTHVHHKFLNLGLEHRFTVVVIYSISLFWALIALLLHRLPEYLLLYAYFAITFSCYLGLRFVLKHPQRFPWLRNDSQHGLRQSQLYRKVAEKAEGAVPVLMGLYLIYLTSGVLIGGPEREETWGLMGLLSILGIGLLAWSRNERFSLVLAIFYLGNLVLAFCIDGFGTVIPLSWGPFDRLSDWLFLAMGVLFAFKVLFRQDGELFLGGVELLSLGLAVFAGVVISNLNPSSELLTVLFKGTLLIMVLKVLIGYRPIYRRVAYTATLSALLIGMLQGMI